MPDVWFVSEDAEGFFPDREPIMFREKGEAETYRDHRVDTIKEELGGDTKVDVKSDGDVRHIYNEDIPASIMVHLFSVELSEEGIEAYLASHAEASL